jgi:hypothetical protein
MPFFTHIFTGNVFNIMKFRADPDLAKKVAVASQPGASGTQVMEETLVIQVPHKKMIELVQTRREIWYIRQEEWDAAAAKHEPGEQQRTPGTLAYYKIPELQRTGMMLVQAVGEKNADFATPVLMKLNVLEFGESDGGPNATNVTVKATLF